MFQSLSSSLPHFHDKGKKHISTRIPKPRYDAENNLQQVQRVTGNINMHLYGGVGHNFRATDCLSCPPQHSSIFHPNHSFHLPIPCKFIKAAKVLRWSVVNNVSQKFPESNIYTSYIQVPRKPHLPQSNDTNHPQINDNNKH